MYAPHLVGGNFQDITNSIILFLYGNFHTLLSERTSFGVQIIVVETWVKPLGYKAANQFVTWQV